VTDIVADTLDVSSRTVSSPLPEMPATAESCNAPVPMTAEKTELVKLREIDEKEGALIVPLSYTRLIGTSVGAETDGGS
jgi:hypothetical protein